jgi:hypothetical protein
LAEKKLDVNRGPLQKKKTTFALDTQRVVLLMNLRSSRIFTANYLFSRFDTTNPFKRVFPFPKFSLKLVTELYRCKEMESVRIEMRQ